MAGMKPTHVLWYVRDIEGREKDLWTRIGAAWQHKSGKGYNMTMDFYPASAGKYVMLEAKEKPEGDIAGHDPETGEVSS